jgi:2-C-methyl-D-erythritol 4-phosphate cytidylyltransferase
VSDAAVALVPLVGSAPLDVTMDGRPVLAWVLDSLARTVAVSRTLVVTAEPAGRVPHPDVVAVDATAGRLDMLRAGLAAAGSTSIVVIVDADRPLAGPACVATMVQMLDDAPGVVVAAPVKATIKRVEDGVIQGAVPRERLFQVGGPRAFRRDALERVLGIGQTAGDEVDAAVRAGARLAILPDEEAAFHVTDEEDARLAELLLRRVGGGTR